MVPLIAIALLNDRCEKIFVFLRKLQLLFKSASFISLRAEVSYFLCFTREAKETGDVCTQATVSYDASFFSLEIFGRLVVGDEYVELFDVFSSFSVLRGC